MFSENNAYYYQQPQLQLFQRQLPYKSIKLPVKKNQQNERILKITQKKYEVEQLRMQILDRCKFEELQYLELLKRQREIMEDDIKKRKKQIQVRNMEDRIIINRQQQQRNNQARPKANDSLDILQNEHQLQRNRAKTQRTQSAYSSSVSSVGGSRIPTVKAKQLSLQTVNDIKPAIVSKQIEKEQQIKKLKQEMLNKYRFMGEAGKKPAKALQYQNNTEINWWIQKVRKHRLAEAKLQQKKKESETVISDTDSNHSLS